MNLCARVKEIFDRRTSPEIETEIQKPRLLGGTRRVISFHKNRPVHDETYTANAASPHVAEHAQEAARLLLENARARTYIYGLESYLEHYHRYLLPWRAQFKEVTPPAREVRYSGSKESTVIATPEGTFISIDVEYRAPPEKDGILWTLDGCNLAHPSLPISLEVTEISGVPEKAREKLERILGGMRMTLAEYLSKASAGNTSTRDEPLWSNWHGRLSCLDRDASTAFREAYVQAENVRSATDIGLEGLRGVYELPPYGEFTIKRNDTFYVRGRALGELFGGAQTKGMSLDFPTDPTSALVANTHYDQMLQRVIDNIKMQTAGLQPRKDEALAALRELQQRHPITYEKKAA